MTTTTTTTTPAGIVTTTTTTTITTTTFGQFPGCDVVAQHGIFTTSAIPIANSPPDPVGLALFLGTSLLIHGYLQGWLTDCLPDTPLVDIVTSFFDFDFFN